MHFRFQLSINGNTKDDAINFLEASGLSMEMKVEEVNEGGENRFHYRLPKVSTASNLVLKRGVTKSDTSIIQWVTRVLNDGFSSPLESKNLTLSLLDENAKVLRNWSLIDSYPVKCSISHITTQEKTMAIESLEFAYSYFQQNEI